MKICATELRAGHMLVYDDDPVWITRAVQYRRPGVLKGKVHVRLAGDNGFHRFPEGKMIEVEDTIPFVQDDGGRADAGFTGDTGDCVTRAIAIATGLSYEEVYEAMAAGCAEQGMARSARNGVPRKVYDPYLKALGWTWVPTMQIGQGCTVHLTPDELPGGNIIVRLSKHVAAVIDGVLHDNHDCSRGGTRCVYGYWILDKDA